MAYKKPTKKNKTKRSIGPAGASIVSKDGKKIKPSSAKTRKDGGLFPGQYGNEIGLWLLHTPLSDHSQSVLLKLMRNGELCNRCSGLLPPSI